MDQFYTMLEALGVRTIPDSLALAALRPFIADDLTAALAEARARRAAPPDSAGSAAAIGNPYASLPEGYTEHRARPGSARGDTALVPLTFTNADQQPAVSWTDTVIVVRERGRWVVADLRYGAGWEFAARGTLRQVLGQPITTPR